MIDSYFLLVIVLGAAVGVVGTVIFGWLYIKEKAEHSHTFRNLNIMEEHCDLAVEKANMVVDELKSSYDANNKLDEEYRKLLNQKKSSEVRVGKIGENMAPFLDGWPYDPNSFRFLGNPIDGVQFADDKIRFIEIKTGGARLSPGQKKVRELVLNGKVSFVSFRIGTDGCSLVEEDLEI